MRVSLINLGDGARGLYDVNNRYFQVGVGEIVSADLAEVTLKNIQRFQKTDTLLVGPEGAIAPPVKLREALDILKSLDDEPYDKLIARYLQLHRPRSGTDLRPTRGQMRAQVRRIIEDHLQRVQADSTDQKPMTQDDVGADELNKELKRQETGKSSTKKQQSGGKRR